MVICMVVDHLPQTSHLMTRNQKLMTGMGSTPSIGIKMIRMSNRVMETMRMWVTYLIGTSKQLCQCLLQWVQTLQDQICWVKKTNENLILNNVGPAISGQLAEVAKPFCVEESRKVPLVAKIAGRLKMPNNWNFAKVPTLNEEIC